MGLMGEEISKENSRGTRGIVLGASFEDMILRAATHAALKAKGTGTLKFSKRIDRVPLSIARIAALHRLLSW